jgi:hypothetical protein
VKTLYVLLLILAGAQPLSAASGQGGSVPPSRELFVDEALIERTTRLESRLHSPVPRETVMTFDQPWEGSGSDFERLIQVQGVIRMYYMGTHLTSSDGTRLSHGGVYACYAESRDGVHWTKPDLGLRDFEGSAHNNIVWSEPKLDNFTPFLDSNPNCPPEERYKATTSAGAGLLFAVKSADGIHWSRMGDAPIMTHGRFDSQNNAFWDPARKFYWCYVRGFHDPQGSSVQETLHGTVGIRDIRVATSPDFRHWSEPRRLDFGDFPDEALYTNQIEPYYRAPQLFVGFPTRYVDREFTPAVLQALPDPVHRQRRMNFSHRYGSVVTDGQFMTSRDGYHFHRWSEAFLPPGPERSNNWVYGDGYESLGLIETPAADPTSAPELSCYADEGHWKEGETLRRYTLRLDGFVSLHAGREGGELLTRPVRWGARGRLSLNFATSAAGGVRVEVLTAEDGKVLRASEELFGDAVDRTVAWKGAGAGEAAAGQLVRLRFTLHEADLYSLQFD